MIPKFSICIPTYEMNGKGSLYLEDLFDSIKDQTYKNFEIVVSDHSKDTKIKGLCEKWSSTLVIVYVKNEKKRGNSSVNTNNAVLHAKGEIIKIIHQDDFFYDKSALEKIERGFRENPDKVWGVSAFIHTNENKDRFFSPMTPEFENKILSFKNKIGAPSILCFRNEKQISFNEHLIWMNDIELFVRLFKKFGYPLLFDEIFIAIRQWPSQVSNTMISKKIERYEKFTVAKLQLSWFWQKIYLKIKKIPSAVQYRAKNLVIKIYDFTVNIFASLVDRDNYLTFLANIYYVDKGTRKLHKWWGDRHYYSDIYHSYFKNIRKKKLSVLEIGIGGGRSLKMWLWYFPYSKIFGIDTDDYSFLNGKRLRCFVADQSNRNDLKSAMEKIDEHLDIIIDDGGHYMNQQQISFGYLFKYLKPGGLYIIEDLHTSYWPYNGHVSVYNDVPIDTLPDKSNTTLKMLRDFVKNKKFESMYLTKDETEYLNAQVKECVIHDTAINHYGPNHLAVIIKK